jgi:hypothetical protein
MVSHTHAPLRWWRGVAVSILLGGIDRVLIRRRNLGRENWRAMSDRSARSCGNESRRFARRKGASARRRRGFKRENGGDVRLRVRQRLWNSEPREARIGKARRTLGGDYRGAPDKRRLLLEQVCFEISP